MNNISKKFIFVLLLIFMLQGFFCGLILETLYAQTTNKKDFTLDIRANAISAQLKSVVVIKVGNYDRVLIEGLSNIAAAGEPLLPVKTVKFLVPFDKEVRDVNISWMSKNKIEGNYIVEPAQTPFPLSYQGPIIPTAPDQEIYSSYEPYPVSPYKVVSTQYINGYKVLIINIYPVEYIPAKGELFYYENISLNLEFEQIPDAKPHNLYRGIEFDQQKVARILDNSELLDTYPARTTAPLVTYQYVIITSDALKNSTGTYTFQDLTTHKASKGLTTNIVTTAWIYSNYSGADNQTKIRNFISDYYTNYGTQYVLLGGDADASGVASGETEAAPIVPHRGFYETVTSTTVYEDSDIPADMYYACLDGTFDNDGDGIYGETNDGTGGGEVDLLAEVYVGRAPVDSETEVSNFVKKTIAYENSTESYLTSVCMAAEQLDDATYGADYMQEIQSGSSSHGYSTVGMDGTGYFSFATLYEKDRNWPISDLITKLNSGVHILNHLGHSNNTSFAKTSGTPFSNTHADALTNTKYFFGFTQGCYSGAFDNRGTGTTYETEDCVLEHFVTSANGAFAFIGNSRYGWYASASTDGGSQRYHREFWDGVVAEGIVNIGRVLQDAKEDHVGVINDNDVNRWCYFETNLLGDPHTPINAALLPPTDFSATNISISNTSWVTVRWKNSSRTDLQGTMVRYRTDGVYPTDETDGTLLCTRAATPGGYDTFNHTDVCAELTYHYVGFGYDSANNYEGGNSLQNRANATVFGSGTTAGKTGRSDCFIATACYGSGNASGVQSLRKFRDRFLMKFFSGKKFITYYYMISPYFAAIIKQNDELKTVIKQCLQPIIKCAELLIRCR